MTPLPEPRAESGATRHLTRLGSECEFVIRTYVGFPVVLRGRPGTSTCSSAGEPTTSKPGRPRMFVTASVYPRHVGFEIRAEPFGTPLTQGMADAQQAELTE